MTTFTEAREIVRTSLAPSWELGTLYVAPTGLEDSIDYLVEAGASEFILNDNLAYASTSGLVDKEDGTLTLAPYLDHPERYDARIVAPHATRNKSQPNDKAPVEHRARRGLSSSLRGVQRPARTARRAVRRA